MPLEHITDHQDRAVARLVEQYKGSASFTGLVSLSTAEDQVLEDQFWGMFQETLGTAQGAQLDVIGKIVGQPREGRDDATYRIWISARVRVVRSHGTGPELLTIFRLLVPADATLTLTEQYPAAFVLNISGVATSNQDDLVKLLRPARAAGVRGLLQFSAFPPDETFTLDVGPGLDVGHLSDSTE